MAVEAARLLGKTPATTSVISAHLGNGCSITAIRDGLSVDTSMGLTPLEGLVMGTRSGDVDPGLFDFLRNKGMNAEEVHRLLNQDSGLLGLSGQTNDMRSLCELADQGHEPSKTAIEVFCFRLARYIGAMLASFKRLDALVFTGGIGENSTRVREQTTNHLHLMGFEIDPELNQSHGKFCDGRIESADSRFPILVIPTNEELVIAREASRLAGGPEQA
jgi:acetate kinase